MIYIKIAGLKMGVEIQVMESISEYSHIIITFLV